MQISSAAGGIILKNTTSDLRLLAVFGAVMETRNVGQAAERLGLSQPAVSQSLNRLRELMGDQLLLPRRRGMQPTPLAESLYDRVRGPLVQLEDALRQREFDPNVSDWAFDLAVSDHVSVVLLPHLVEHVSIIAPRVTLRAEAKPQKDLPLLLDTGGIDLAIGVIPDLPQRFARRRVFRDRYVCMMRRDHPLTQGPLTLERFTATPQIQIRPGDGNDESRADRILRSVGITRSIVSSVHQFLAAPGIVARSDYVTLIFERMQQVIDIEKFHFAALPDVNMNVNIDAVWNRARGDHDAHRWLRSQIAVVSQRLGEGPEGAPIQLANERASGAASRL